jgi:hypothetical protein
MEDENLGMDLFGSDNYEINLDDNFEIPNEEDDDDSEEQNNPDEEQDQQSNNQGEDQDDSENVAEEEDVSNEGDQGDDSPNLFSSVAAVLHEQGVLPSLDIESSKIKNVDDLATAIRNEADTLYKTTLIEKLGQEGADYILDGVPIKVYDEYKNNSDTLNSITEESLQSDIELSKNIVYQDYINKGLSEAKALKFVEKSVELGDDSIIDDAKESLLSIKDFNKKFIESEKTKSIETQKQVESQRLANEKSVKDSVYNTKELIKNQPFTKAVQDRVYKSITNIIGKSPDGDMENALMKARREDMVDFDTKLYYLFELTKGFKDFSSLTRSGKNSAIKDLENALKQGTELNGDAPSYLQDVDSYDGIKGTSLNF